MLCKMTHVFQVLRGRSTNWTVTLWYVRPMRYDHTFIVALPLLLSACTVGNNFNQVCLSLSVCLFGTATVRKFIFSEQKHLDDIWVKYQGHWIKVKVKCIKCHIYLTFTFNCLYSTKTCSKGQCHLKVKIIGYQGKCFEKNSIFCML